MRARIFTIWLIGYILGSMTAPLFETAMGTYLIIGLVLIASSLFIFSKKYVFAIICALGIFLVSLSAFQYKEAGLVRQNEALSKGKIEVVGFVSQVPTTNEFGQTVPLTLHTVNGIPEHAKLKAYAPAFPRFKYGQIVRFEAKVKPYGEKKWRIVKDSYAGEVNIGDYTITGSERGIGVNIKGALFAVRDRFNEVIARSLPGAESGLASGLLLGEKALISPEVTRQLQISGTTHIIALSGYNITIILGLFVIFRHKLTRLLNLLVPVLFILAFVIMTGGAASLIRAAIMGFMPLLASFLGRESDSFIAILLSAVVMIAVNPFLALFDVGFQLSFTALAGMIYFAPILTRLLAGLPDYLLCPLSETTGAQLAAMPLLAYYFGSVSVISPLSNLVILSFVPVGMLTAFVIGLTGLIWQGFANLIAMPGYVILHTINWFVALFGSLPAASKSIKIENPVWILLAYFLIFDIWLIFSKKVRRARPTG